MRPNLTQALMFITVEKGKLETLSSGPHRLRFNSIKAYSQSKSQKVEVSQSAVIATFQITDISHRASLLSKKQSKN